MYKIKHLKSHNFVWQGCFRHDQYWAQIFTAGWLCYAHLEIHRVRWLVFEIFLPIVSSVFKQSFSWKVDLLPSHAFFPRVHCSWPSLYTLVIQAESKRHKSKQIQEIKASGNPLNSMLIYCHRATRYFTDLRPPVLMESFPCIKTKTIQFRFIKVINFPYRVNVP